MKKRMITALLMVALLCGLCACNVQDAEREEANTSEADQGQSQNTDETSEQPEESATENEVLADHEESPNEDTPEEKSEKVKTFGAQAEDLIEAMSLYLDATGTTNALATEPYVEEMDNGTTAYAYEIAAGCEIVFYAETTSGELAQVFIWGQSDLMDTDGARLLGTYSALAPEYFTTESELQELDAELNIANTSFSENVINMYTGSKADFMFIMNNGTATLSISPLS